jgi:aspartyl/asparaginyl beta-hydroxylase
MSAFTILGWLDVFDLAASLPKRMGEFEGKGRRICRKSWTELEDLTLLLRNAGNRLGHVTENSFQLEMLDAGHCSPWRKAEGILRMHLVLRTNPHSILYSGIESMSPGQGVIVVFDPRVPFSAINLGETPRIHLIGDWKQNNG